MRPRVELEQIFARISEKYTFEDAHLELATDKRMDAIIKFAKEEFAPDEPVGRSLEIEYDEEVVELIRYALKDNISVLLISNKTDEIIAVRLCEISARDENLEEQLKQLKNKNILQFFKFITHKDKESNAFDKYGVDKYVHFMMLGVDRRFRRKGLATKIMEASMEFYSEIGFDRIVLKGEGTSNYSKKIYEKFGFDKMHEMVYDEYKVDGNVLLKNMGEHKSCVVYAKLISAIN